MIITMWCKLFFSLLLVQHLNAECDVCRSGHAACHSRTEYSICLDGKPAGQITPCPTGYICTGEKYICNLEADGYEPICLVDDANAETPTTEEATTLTVGTLVPFSAESTTTTTMTDYTGDANYKQFCTLNGDGSHANDNDSSCKTFIFCYAGRGIIDVCQKLQQQQTYFNGLKCVREKPDYCT
ncbi:hypothetical protein KR222_002349 [Zaprionus bogoriensis]|nr:hypothetical protein KR222_002349 [Zaprionus bogoriensis]